MCPFNASSVEPGLWRESLGFLTEHSMNMQTVEPPGSGGMDIGRADVLEPLNHYDVSFICSWNFFITDGVSILLPV